MDNQNEVNNNPLENIPNSQTGNHHNIFIFNSVIDSLSGWMKFIGIYTIVLGAITCIGIITAAIGVPLIFAGIALTNGSKSIKAYKNYNSPYILKDIFTAFNKYFKIQGILIIIGIILTIVYILIAILALVMSINGYFRYY